MKYDRFGSFGHIIPRFFLVCKGCREKHTHFNKKLFSLNTLFHEGAPLPLAKNCTPLKSKMHPPPNRNCTPLNGFLSKLEAFAIMWRQKRCLLRKARIYRAFLLPKRRFFSVPKRRCKIAVFPLRIDLNSRKVNIRYTGR